MHSVHDKHAAKRFCIFAKYDRWPQTRASLQIFPQHWPTPSFHYSTCATLRSHLSNSWALAKFSSWPFISTSTYTVVTRKPNTIPACVLSVHLSSSSKCASPPMPAPGKYACASVFPGPSKGLPSPCSLLLKSISISDTLVVSLNDSLDTSAHICQQCAATDVYRQSIKQLTPPRYSYFRIFVFVYLYICMQMPGGSAGTRQQPQPAAVLSVQSVAGSVHPLSVFAATCGYIIVLRPESTASSSTLTDNCKQASKQASPFMSESVNGAVGRYGYSTLPSRNKVLVVL